MPLAYDTLSDEDRRLAQELAVRLQPHVDDIVAAWAEAWLQEFPAPGVDPEAYRQVIVYSMDNALRPAFELTAAGNFDGLYARQYDVNRQGARAQLREGSVPLFDQRQMHVVARMGHHVMIQWIRRVFADDPVQCLRVELAQERLGAQLSTILSEAYSDEREGHLQALSQRLERALRVSEQLRHVGQTVVQSLDIEPVLDVTLQTALQLLDGDSAGLTLANRDGTAIQLRRFIGGDQSAVGTWAPVEGNLNGWVYQHAQPLRSDRPLPPLGAHSRAVIERLGIVAFMVVPLRVGGQCIGALGVSYHAERRFSDEDERVLQSLADAVAIAMQNARAHTEVRDALREAERANHAKSEFVAAVSHEIRSPLNALLGYVQLLREGAFGPVTREQGDTLTRLDAIAHSTLRLTSDLLEHARIEVGKLPVRIERVPLPPFLEELRESGRLLVEGRPVEFAARLLPGVEAVAADPDRLRQIVINLLTNAAKFTPRGSITLTLGPSTRPNMVDFTVRDTGPGIAPDDLPRIFDLFYRADRSSGVSGAGIGLFLSRQLATLMGGQLTVDSTLGVGTTFTLSLPRGDGE